MGTARKIDSQSAPSIDGTSNRVTVDIVEGSCRMGRRRCPRRGPAFVRDGEMVAGEAASDERSGGNSWRRAITSF